MLKPGGRLIVGELFGDPHMVTSGKLRERGARAGLSFARRVGGPLAFFARLDDVVRLGRTDTNVGDIQILLVKP